MLLFLQKADKCVPVRKGKMNCLAILETIKKLILVLTKSKVNRNNAQSDTYDDHGTKH